MDRLVLASNNPGKLKELQSLFAPLGLTLVAQSEFGTPEAEEPFHTFVENALAKARHASAHTGLPASADSHSSERGCRGRLYTGRLHSEPAANMAPLFRQVAHTAARLSGDAAPPGSAGGGGCQPGT